MSILKTTPSRRQFCVVSISTNILLQGVVRLQSYYPLEQIIFDFLDSIEDGFRQHFGIYPFSYFAICVT